MQKAVLARACTRGLVVEFILAMDEIRARFPASAKKFFFPSRLRLTMIRLAAGKISTPPQQTPPPPLPVEICVLLPSCRGVFCNKLPGAWLAALHSEL